MRASWNKGSAYSWQKLMWNDAKVRWLLALTMYTKPFSHRREWGKKSPLWSFIIDWAFYQGTENENEHWLTGAGARKRERDWESERGKSLYFFLRSLAREFKKKMDIWASPKSLLLSKTEKTLWTIINGLENTFSSLSDGHQSKVK